jgi:hypothetical protein
MEETKKVTIIRAGGTASTDAIDVFPSDTVDQLCTLVAPKLGLPEGGFYQLLGPNGKPIGGDLYKSLNNGDKLTLAQIGQGGHLMKNRFA